MIVTLPTSLSIMIPAVLHDNHDDLPSEDIGNQVTIRWLDGGRILMTRMETDTRACYDTWEAFFVALKAHWPPERKTLYALYDISSPRFGITMYSAQKVRAFVRDERPYTVHGAVMLANNPLSSSLIFLLRSNRKAEQLNFSFFTDRAKAMLWLNNKIRRNGD